MFSLARMVTPFCKHKLSLANTPLYIFYMLLAITNTRIVCHVTHSNDGEYELIWFYGV